MFAVEDSLKASLVIRSLCRVLRQMAGGWYNGDPGWEKASTVTLCSYLKIPYVRECWTDLYEHEANRPIFGIG